MTDKFDLQAEALLPISIRSGWVKAIDPECRPAVAAALREQLAEARTEALEEAAKLADTFPDWCLPIGMYVNMSMAEDFGHELAAAIRERKSKP